ncbi:malto-oligosyltrehalose trehalohydrolase [Marmoricola sp. RAF53]|uniref:malto-oligosyltrehalose trehalohydrolase n=1 Tax=Marmoricola sp. RAF53 TaxID=3233059 RepID=UPI003F9BD17F
MAFEVWAPRPGRVRLQVDGRVVPMTRDPTGWWRPAEPVGGGDYGYLLDDDERALPDPRSRWQPEGVHGLSRAYDPGSFAWTDQAWTGRQLAGAILYEAHVGTFTPEGTLDAMIERLPHLVDLGVGFLELLPVNAFNGRWNWGYDGVGWWAVHHEYGGPAAYQRLVDACHAAGIGVVQDVVYNHLGPSGNYLPRFGPYLKDQESNTWGQAVNLDGEGSAEVRRAIVENALMWLGEMHVDGLRLDAVHALTDSSDRHLLEELATEVSALSAHQNRPLSLIAESDLNDPRLITPRAALGFGLDAQWSDDFHHAVHANVTGEDDGYYADFADPDALVKVLNRGFFHDGTFSSFRGRAHGRPIETDRTEAWRLVVCAQNHDQIGNRARGDRLTESLTEDQLACVALLLLTAPFTPMLFQGEEWAASTPFRFFTSHPEPDLGEATARGRLEEFARMGWDPAEVPDPQDEQTFLLSRLDWSEPAKDGHARILDLHRRLIALRRARPELTRPTFGAASVAGRLLTVERGDLTIRANLGPEPVTLASTDELLLGTRPDATGTHLPPWSGVVTARTTG